MSRLLAAISGSSSISVVSSAGADAPPLDQPDESSKVESYGRSSTIAAVTKLDSHPNRLFKANPACNIIVGSYCFCTFLTRPTCASACHDKPAYPVETGRPRLSKNTEANAPGGTYPPACKIRYTTISFAAQWNSILILENISPAGIETWHEIDDICTVARAFYSVLCQRGRANPAQECS